MPLNTGTPMKMTIRFSMRSVTASGTASALPYSTVGLPLVLGREESSLRVAASRAGAAAGVAGASPELPLPALPCRRASVAAS